MHQINAREFQKGFSKVAGGLQPGQTIAITRRGKPLGFFTKAPRTTNVPMPDFAANLANVTYPAEVAENIVCEVADEPVS